jgi:hypothetical protein
MGGSGISFGSRLGSKPVRSEQDAASGETYGTMDGQTSSEVVCSPFLGVFGPWVFFGAVRLVEQTQLDRGYPSRTQLASGAY